MFKRFFSFGCSYTKYRWSTWADIIADDLQIEYHNLAKEGMGNVGIMHEIIKTDLEYKFTKQDLIIVLWSHWNREDRFIDGEWKSGGNIFTNEFYDDQFVEKYWSFENDIIKNATAIISINKIYQSIISFQGHIMPPGDFETIENHLCISDIEKKLIDLYFPHFEKSNVFPNAIHHYLSDDHPDVLSHLDYVQYVIYPSINIKLKDLTFKKYLNKHQHNIFLLKKNKTVNQKLY